MKGVTFGNYHSFEDLALILTQKIIGTPTPKKELVEISGEMVYLIKKRKDINT